MDPNNHDESQIYKIVIIGDTGTGKTNIITKYVSNYFEGVLRPTIGVEFFQKNLDIETPRGSKDPVTLQLWDTAGQERFRGMASSYYRKAFGVLLVYDITNKESFNNLDRWMEEINSYADHDIEIVLVGNKKDLVEQREVTPNEGIEFSQVNRLLFYETSALVNDDQKIEEMFKELTYRIHNNDRVKRMREASMNESVRKAKNLIEINSKPKRNGRGCC